ncbi:MAG: ABC transporter ATP-binding protein [Solirubrobacterales bacterium]
MAEPAVALRGLCRDFGERRALRDVDLELAAGGSLAVLGPNGAGKSTLLRICATLLRPTAGQLTVLGCDLPRDGWKLRRRLGFLGHQPLLYRDLTGRENLRFHAALHGLGAETADARIAWLLERVEMGRRADDRVDELSRGMLQRLAVCRALVHDPDLLLVDEPLSHLDPRGAELVAPLIGPATDRTRIHVTHHIEAGLADADHVLVLGPGGRTLHSGRTAGLDRGLVADAYAGGPR